MVLDLSRILGESEHLERLMDPTAFVADAESFRVVAPAKLVADVRKDGAQFHFVGRVEAELECVCSRCLEAFVVPVASDITIRFLPASDPAPAVAAGRGGREDRDRADDDGQEVQADDLGVSFYRDDEIDLFEVAREQFYLALPMKPLCQPECKGLCPVCGVNRNRESCTCQTTWVDPRMDALRKLRKD